ncbi:MAG: UDP-N-acetylglucosamine 1-carboxyvinyltransferase [Actinomycetota bacterium]|nr:UDP-N-acetylglucosamine 1-carboxyvinyltransferase [Acidimicrobiaceae bacterium]MEC7917046.1 UDP-N-acetylglucosamine 1-carboxyvinyltransferase [Actinomycetota bacterium]MEC9058090.1 UDP-N-acetylglucosamine 1-carboxyvinyltransferase [Actinomycetota bacterium]MED5362529.1 UDP-N-acetylglucosamine 1-carboxyvinyltransferase [Actinomycetota bacterium]
MDKFLVQGSGPLNGEVRIGGAKNSALKLMAASLLAEGSTSLLNVPDITDVAIMIELLEAMGVRVQREGHRIDIDVPAEIDPVAPYSLVERMRASIVVLGPLLSRIGRAQVAMPGGDDFGSRPIDMHLQGLEQLGATFSYEHGDINGRAEQLLGTEVFLEFPSVGATENLLMAAVLAEGTTVIENAAREPEIGDLANFLLKMGALIDGIGTSRLRIEGVTVLRPVTYEVIADRIEAATYLAALAVCGGELRLQGARPDHMEMLLRKLEEMGMACQENDSGLEAKVRDRLKAVDISTLPYPGLATDYKPFLVTALCVSHGAGMVTENIFAGRFRYIDELVRMGAEIRAEGRHAVVRGVERLSGAPVRAHDIRAGAALVIAGLAADGETVISDAHHVDRGYEDLAGKLSSVGAQVTRV